MVLGNKDPVTPSKYKRTVAISVSIPFVNSEQSALIVFSANL